MFVSLFLSFVSCEKKKRSPLEMLFKSSAHTTCVKVFDPKLEGEPKVTINYAIEPRGYEFQVDVKIMDGNTQVRLLVNNANQIGGYDYSVVWDGKNDSGKYVDPKKYTVVIDAQSSKVTPITKTAEITVVRLGVCEIDFEGAAANQEFPLVYPKRDATSTSDFAISGAQWAIQSLDENTGLPRAEAVPNVNALYPDNASSAKYNYPACYLAGTKIRFKAKTGQNAVSNINGATVSANYPLADYPIMMRVNGYSPQPAASNENITPNTIYTFESDSGLPSSCGIDIVKIEFTFYYNDGTNWVRIPGKQTTTHRICRTVGVPRWVDYTGDGNKENFVYVPLAEWSCKWASGCSNLKSVADACFYYIEESGLKYGGISAWYTADLLDKGGGMCDGWNDFFDHLVAVQGFATAKYFYGLSANAGVSPEVKWASIVIKSPGTNRTTPAHPVANDYRCVDSAYPIPRYYSDSSPNDDVVFYSGMTWYKFGSPTMMDGHAINFVEWGGVIYLYDASFRNTFGPNPKAGTFSSLPPNGYMQGAGLANFKSIYYNSAIDYHEGDVYCDNDGNPNTPPVVRTLDIKTSLFSENELRLYWLKEN
jgi:hypothetical protein